jgi:hypothetical protein
VRALALATSFIVGLPSETAVIASVFAAPAATLASGVIFAWMAA